MSGGRTAAPRTPRRRSRLGLRAGLLALAGSVTGVVLAPAALAQAPSVAAGSALPVPTHPEPTTPQPQQIDRSPSSASASRDPDASLASANYGFQKIRIGVRRADGSYLPHRPPGGAVLAVTEAGPDADLLPASTRRFVCTTDATGFCPDTGITQATNFLASLSGGPAYRGPRPNLLLPGDHATITQLRRPDVPGLAAARGSLLIRRCVAATDPVDIVDYFCGTSTHVYATDGSSTGSSAACRPGDDVGAGALCLAATPAVLVDHHPPPRPHPDRVSVRVGRVVDVDVLADDATFGLPGTLRVGRPAFGRAGVLGSVVRYVAPKTWGGLVRVPYSLTTATGTGTSVVVVRVEAPPLARPDHRRDAGATIRVDVLRNDDAEHGGRLTLVHVAAPRHGRAGVEDGRVVYTPAPGFGGVDVVHYVVANRYGRSVGTLRLDVTPAAAPDSARQTPTTGLADTGAEPAQLLLAGLGLLAAGTALAAVGRRRPGGGAAPR